MFFVQLMVNEKNDSVKDAAAKVVKDASESGAEKTVKFINDLSEINFLEVIVVAAATGLAIWAVRRLGPYLADRSPQRLRLFLLGAVPILRLIFLTMAILWIIPIIFNVTFENFIVAAGAISVALGFAFKDYFSSLVAGVVAVFEKPYRPGDWVKIGGDYGEVTAVGLRSLSIRTPADDTVTIPHDKIWQENVLNSNDGAKTLMCVVNFYVHPDHDATRLRRVLRDVGLTSPYLRYDHPVVVMLSETPMGTHYKLKAYPFEMRDQFSFISDLTIRGKIAIEENGGREVSLPSLTSGEAGDV
ncbi:mechanosensitive ion channel family protein [bacterium]|nr:mechanosensitive ion channel family protein [bacterium]